MNMPFRFQPSREIEDAKIISETPHGSTDTPTTMNPNPEKAVPQNNPESGTNNGMTDAFEKLGVSPASFPKEIAHEAANDPKRERHTRGGRGSKASAELTQLIKMTLEENKIKDRQLETELKKDEKLFDKEVERMEDVYSQFSEDLDALEKRLSEETNYKSKKRLNALKSQAKDHLRVLRRFFPKEQMGAQSEYDTEVFKSVAEKFKKYEEARRRQTIAEIDLNKKGGSIGKHEEARNEALKLREEISSLIKQGESVISQNSPHPAQDDSIGNIRTEGSELMRAVQPEANPEELIRIEPAGTGSLELPKEEQVGKIEQGSRTVEDAQINTTTAALANQTESESTQATANDWQAEAVKNWEETSGKKVPDLELEHSPEEHNAILPVLTGVVGKTVNAPQEGRGETAPETPKLDLTPEQAELVKKLEDNIANISDKVEARAEKTGMDKGVLRRVGEKWNEFPLRYKLLLSAGMLVSGFGAAALGATATVGTIATIGAGIRGFSGAGMFVGFEKMLKDSAEKKSGSERTKSEELRHTVLAASLSILVAGVLPGIVRDYAVEHGFFDKVRELFGGHTAHTEAPTKIGTVQATSEYVGVAEAGDSRWSLAERALAEGPYKDQFNAIASDEQRTYVIDALKDKLTTGMTAGQANALNIGDKIDFKEIFADKDFINETFSGAQHLSAPEIANIQNYNVETVMEAPVETPATVVSAGELLNQPLITDFTPPEPSALTPNEIATPEPPVTPGQTLPLAEVSLAHANALVEAGTLKGHFSYSPSGAVDGFTVEGDASSVDGHNLLNKHWQHVVRGHDVAGLGDTNISAVEGEAGKLTRYEHILDALKQKGAGASPEADFLKRHIDGIITNTEKTYGHVFKNIGDFSHGAEAVPAEVAPVTSDTSQAMPQEIAPKDPQVLAYIDQQFHNDVDTLFGKKGFMGLGSVDGIKSPHWLDFENRTLLEIKNSTPTGGSDSVGINNPEAHKKIESYLMNVFKESKIQPEEGETVGKYIKRAMEITASRLQTK